LHQARLQIAECLSMSNTWIFDYIILHFFQVFELQKAVKGLELFMGVVLDLIMDSSSCYKF
jgi:hypothetical protein